MTAIQRLNYFTSQFLVENDFQDEQSYHRNMRLMHNKSFHTLGVVGNGLLVSKVDNTNNQIKVSPGMAIDKDGQEIVLLTNSDPVTLSNNNTDVFVAIQYTELPDVPDTTSGLTGKFRRTTEKFQIASSTTKPPTDGSVIQLARVKVDNGGNIIEIHNEERILAGAAIAPQSITTDRIEDGAVTKAKLNISPQDIGALDTSKGGNIQANLMVTGNLGIGTINPTGKLSVSSTGGDGKSVTIDTSEIKFRGDGLAHFSIFANKTSGHLTIEDTSSSGLPGVKDSTVLISLNRADGLKLTNGVAVNEFSDDSQLTKGSSAVPTVNAVKTFANALISRDSWISNAQIVPGTLTVDRLVTPLQQNLNTLTSGASTDASNLHFHRTIPVQNATYHVPLAPLAPQKLKGTNAEFEVDGIAMFCPKGKVAIGLIPLHLPHNAKLTQITLDLSSTVFFGGDGQTPSALLVSLELNRVDNSNRDNNGNLATSITSIFKTQIINKGSPEPKTTTQKISPHTVDNFSGWYWLKVQADATDSRQNINIAGVSIRAIFIDYTIDRLF